MNATPTTRLARLCDQFEALIENDGGTTARADALLDAILSESARREAARNE